MTETRLNDLFSYAVEIRRTLHEYPEVGFELPNTVALVTAELDRMGIPHTDRYGTCSVVAELGQGDECVALRADMDALPVEEKTDLPYRSKVAGKMHACGHDAHTAILLAVAKHLKAQESVLPCRVRLIFQPAEESAVSGAEMMVKNGVMAGVSHILCTHCEPSLESGTLGMCSGDYMAACVPLTVRFLGKTAHAASPQGGVDAVAMAVEAYSLMKDAVVREAGELPHIWCVGRLCGGQAHNVVPELCEMDISFRFYDMAFAARVEAQVRSICEDVATRYGGKAEVLWHMSTGPVHNHEMIAKRFEAVVNAADLPLCAVERKMTSEDFGWYLTKAPGILFRFGAHLDECDCSLHQNNFMINEDGMMAAIRAFAAYVLNFR